MLADDGRLVVATLDPATFGEHWLVPWFPSIPRIDADRFPSAERLDDELREAGFGVRVERLVQRELDRARAGARQVRGRAFSTFDLLDEAELRAGARPRRGGVPGAAAVPDDLADRHRRYAMRPYPGERLLLALVTAAALAVVNVPNTADVSRLGLTQAILHEGSLATDRGPPTRSTAPATAAARTPTRRPACRSSRSCPSARSRRPTRFAERGRRPTDLAPRGPPLARAPAHRRRLPARVDVPPRPGGRGPGARNRRGGGRDVRARDARGAARPDDLWTPRRGRARLRRAPARARTAPGGGRARGRGRRRRRVPGGADRGGRRRGRGRLLRAASVALPAFGLVPGLALLAAYA